MSLRRSNFLTGLQIVPITKDGTVRICEDCKLTINKVAKIDEMSTKIDKLFAALTGGRTFSKLELSQAYQ